jgi:hypothetical protein
MPTDQLPNNADLLAAQHDAFRPTAPEGEARFVVSGNDLQANVKIEAPDSLVRGVANFYFEGEQPEPRTVMTIDFVNDVVSIFPQLIAFSDRLYKQKYRQIREIQLDLPTQGGPLSGHFEVMELVKELPTGFVRDPQYGLGVIKEMRPLIHAIEQIEGVTRLVIAENEQTRVQRSTFYLNAAEYRQLQQGMSRTTRTYQAESLADRQLLAYNASAHRAAPDKFPHKDRAYKPGTVFRLLGGAHANSVTLKGKDRVGLLQAVANNAGAIADRDPQEFIQLQKDIELVSLEKLIDAVQKKLNKNSKESAWQSLLELNPFLLSILFGQPIVLLQASASVGGQKLTGHGTKIVDFLNKNTLTNNAALVEIKRPKTPLLNMKEYRGGVYGPSRELMGSIAQVLDQRLKLVTGIKDIVYSNRQIQLEVPAVECVVLAGITPTGQEAISSFELIRHSFKDVRIITFNELLERLNLLRDLLAGERYASTVEDETGQWGTVFEEYGEEGEEPEETIQTWQTTRIPIPQTSSAFNAGQW